MGNGCSKCCKCNEHKQIHGTLSSASASSVYRKRYFPPLTLSLSHSLPCLPQLVDVTCTFPLLFPFSVGPEAMCPSRTPIAFASHKQATPSSWPWSMCSARMPDTIRSLRARKATMSYARMSNSLSRTDPQAKIHQCSCVVWSISPSKWALARVCSPKYAAQQN